jgi:hypothetical protein
VRAHEEAQGRAGAQTYWGTYFRPGRYLMARTAALMTVVYCA